MRPRRTGARAGRRGRGGRPRSSGGRRAGVSRARAHDLNSRDRAQPSHRAFFRRRIRQVAQWNRRPWPERVAILASYLVALEMLFIWGRGGHDMSTTLVRVLVGIVVVAGLLGIGALEVVSERVRVDPASTAVHRAPEGRSDSSPAYLADFEVREEPGPSPAHLSGSVQTGRQTVL